MTAWVTARYEAGTPKKGRAATNCVREGEGEGGCDGRRVNDRVDIASGECNARREEETTGATRKHVGRIASRMEWSVNGADGAGSIRDAGWQRGE